jgi:predicted kinase
MRRLIVTLGCPGSGKSTTLRRNGLEPFSISVDAVRLLLAGPALSPDGSMGITQEQSHRAWGLALSMLAERMERGELVCMDATHAVSRDMNEYARLAKRHGYDVLVLDHSSVPVDTAIGRNARRSTITRVPETSVRRLHAACASISIPNEFKKATISQKKGEAEFDDAIEAFLSTPTMDLSGVRRVIHVGDVQGCLDPLAGPRGLFPNGLSPDDFHVFHGDYLDRGLQNGEVARWLLDNAIGRENVVLLRGNHEKHLVLHANGLPPLSEEFAAETLPQLNAAGISQADVGRITENLRDAFFYRRNGVNVACSHAGLSGITPRLAEIPAEQLISGGAFGTPIDLLFERNAPDGWIQVHGHRNSAGLPVKASDKSFNLEGAVEAGGSLRALVIGEPKHTASDALEKGSSAIAVTVIGLSGDGVVAIEIPNRNFKPLSKRLADDLDRALRFSKTKLPPWAENPNSSMPIEELATLKAHPLVMEKNGKAIPGVHSYNFTKEAFGDGRWDDVNLRARGLFVDVSDHEIVARSYDKFFNVNERTETELPSLRKTLRFPLSIYDKENGYLGIAGYSGRTDALFLASKSTPDSEFAEWFREIMSETLPREKLDELRRFFRDTGSGAAFEVIDPTRDPHIIAYPERKVVLLDVIRRAPRFERMPYDDLKSVGARFGLETKKRALVLRDWDAFEGWHASLTERGTNGPKAIKTLEGYVVEDAAGFQTKIKLPYYSFWKKMRGLKDRLAVIDGTGRSLGRLLVEPEEIAFKDWLLSHSEDIRPKVLASDIITLREAFVEGRMLDENTVRVERGRTITENSAGTRRPDAEPQEIIGFRAAISGLSQSAAPIKSATAEKIIATALGDERKRAILAENPILPAILAALPPEAAGAAAERLNVAERLRKESETGKRKERSQDKR